MIYETCEICGAHLDPGEECECSAESMNTESSEDKLIVLRQLPVIEEHLHKIKDEVTSKVATALSLVCTEDTVKAVKAARTELNKDFSQWENQRMEIKTAIHAPYEQFNAVYKECVSDVFKNADEQLKDKIDSVENELKSAKAAEVRAYFDEYAQSQDIDFVSFEQAGLSVTLSASIKSLKEKAKAFIDKIAGDLAVIETQEYRDEILYEYKQSLKLSDAVSSVINRHRAVLESEKERRQAEKQDVSTEAKNEPLAAPKMAEPEDEQIYSLAFTVWGTKTKLKELKEFLDNGGCRYEQ